MHNRDVVCSLFSKEQSNLALMDVAATQTQFNSVIEAAAVWFADNGTMQCSSTGFPGAVWAGPTFTFVFRISGACQSGCQKNVSSGWPCCWPVQAVAESVTDFTDLILLFVARKVLTACHPAQRSKPTFLRMSLQKPLHWLSFRSLPRRQCILLKVSSISTTMHLTFLTCTNTSGIEKHWWKKDASLGRERICSRPPGLESFCLPTPEGWGLN